MRSGSSTRLVEAVVTAIGGAAIGYLFGHLLGWWLDLGAGPATAFAVIAGLNGLFAGARRSYAWKTAGGWLAFVLDSSWAMVSTLLGVLVNTYNTSRRGTGYGPEYSIRRNRHVFAGGFALKRGFANTQGNVISNACLGRGDTLADHENLIERHEGLHVWQQRWFGPLHPLIYVIWGAIGIVVGGSFGLASRQRKARGVKVGKLIETAAYYDNPFEYWAYRHDERWDRNSAQPVLKWGSFKWPPSEDR
jgi:hypothetical protein